MQHTPMREKYSQLGAGDVGRLGMSYGAAAKEKHGPGKQRCSMSKEWKGGNAESVEEVAMEMTDVPL